MAKVAVEHVFTGTTTPLLSYDSTKTSLGTLITQKTGTLGTDKFAGPLPLAVGRPMEASTTVAVAYPHAINYTSTLDWIFLGETTAGVSRRVIMYVFDKTTQTFTWKGFVTLQPNPNATNHTIRGVRVLRHLYTTGTVGVSGTAVTGSGTGWQTARYAAGARIGFGSTDPTAISTWYYISSINSDTSITLSGTAGTIASGTPFVIEELRVLYITTNATATNGGLFLAKGLNPDDFSSTGTTIPAAVSTDNVKAVYWLKDAATINMTAAGGVEVMDLTSNTSHDAYFLNADSTTTVRIYKFNLRAALTVASGAATNAFVYRTGVSPTLNGTVAQTNSMRYANCNHGPGSGVDSMYFVTTSRIYRIPISMIVDASTTFVADAMVEIPPGGSNTYAVTSAMSSIEYAGQIDRFIITTSSTSKQYLTRYNTNADPMDHAFLADTKQIDQSTADITNTTPHPAQLSSTFSVWSTGGMMYLCRNGTGATTCHIYAVPIGAHWTYGASNNQRLITPSLATPNASKLYRAYVTNLEILGSDNLGMAPEPYKLYARTSGISDNSGTWTYLSGNYDLSGLSPGTEIQLMFEFRIAGLTCIPARIFSCAVVYEDNATDSHYQTSAGKSDTANNRFAWRFSTAWGSTVPTLRVRLYDAVTGALLVDDNTASPTGSFQKTTDGSTWGSYNTTDKGNETTYIRYTPASLAAGITVRALLTQQ